jgi:hypothetical protein
VELQEYLRQHGLETLSETYHIKVTRHRQYPDLAKQTGIPTLYRFD